MSHERRKEPSNGVAINKYLSESKHRVSTKLVREDWYIARLIDLEPESISRFASDILMRVVKVTTLKNGAKKVYGLPVNGDGAQEVSDDDAVAMNSDGYLIEAGDERGYLLDAFKREPRVLGGLAAGAMVER
jgi:hypothetical protein